MYEFYGELAIALISKIKDCFYFHVYFDQYQGIRGNIIMMHMFMLSVQ